MTWLILTLSCIVLYGITDILLKKQPREHFFNVGNPETVTIRQWVELCYNAAGKVPHI